MRVKPDKIILAYKKLIKNNNYKLLQRMKPQKQWISPGAITILIRRARGTLILHSWSTHRKGTLRGNEWKRNKTITVHTRTRVGN